VNFLALLIITWGWEHHIRESCLFASILSFDFFQFC
jgi:hypothetical protein